MRLHTCDRSPRRQCRSGSPANRSGYSSGPEWSGRSTNAQRERVDAQRSREVFLETRRSETRRKLQNASCREQLRYQIRNAEKRFPKSQRRNRNVDLDPDWATKRCISPVALKSAQSRSDSRQDARSKGIGPFHLSRDGNEYESWF